jgi:hypothetical protein
MNNTATIPDSRAATTFEKVKGIIEIEIEVEELDKQEQLDLIDLLMGQLEIWEDSLTADDEGDEP